VGAIFGVGAVVLSTHEQIDLAHPLYRTAQGVMRYFEEDVQRAHPYIFVWLDQAAMVMTMTHEGEARVVAANAW
jgi:tRNA G18 (ribose-2'-O)-methylase SpoU